MTPRARAVTGALAAAALLCPVAAAPAQDPNDPDIYRPAPKPKAERNAEERARVRKAVPGGDRLTEDQIRQGVVVTPPVVGPTPQEVAAAEARAAAALREARRQAAVRRRAAARRRAARRRAAERAAERARQRRLERRALAALEQIRRRARVAVEPADVRPGVASSRATRAGDDPLLVLLLVGGLPAAALVGTSVAGRARGTRIRP